MRVESFRDGDGTMVPPRISSGRVAHHYDGSGQRRNCDSPRTRRRRCCDGGAAVSGVALPETEAGALTARTEGWAAGLQLAALSLRGQPDAAGFVAAFTGNHRYVLDFLAEEVLEHQSEQVRTFLPETSVLERLSGELRDAVTGRPGSQALLEQAERAGLFLVPLDEVRGWWRYHHLFADLLRARLQAERPGRVARLHRNAAAWYDDHEMADDAIRHAVAAGEPAWAARLIEQHFDELIYLRGEGVTVQRWLAALPGDLVRTRPRLLLGRLTWHRSAAAGKWWSRCSTRPSRRTRGTAEEPFEPTVGRAGSLLVNVPALIAIRRGFLAQLRGDAEDTATFASRALAESEEGEWLLSSTARGLLAMAERLRAGSRMLSAPS
jgi:LuxR family maltose regulon positive regulatory protein